MADFRINVVVDPSGARRGARQTERELNRVGASANRLRTSLTRAFAFAGIGIGLQQTIGVLSSYEQAMSTVRAITKASEADFKALREETQRLGATTRFSASQAAEGAQFLARAGFSTTEVLESLDDTLLLAQAGALDLGRAADIASNILTGFRLETDQASRVVDVLAKAANSANTDVNQLGEAMKFVAPVAAGLGVSVEEATSAVSALSNAGLQSSLAGTGLRRILAELESPASKTQKIFKALGVSTDEVRVSQVGLTTALQRLRDAGVDTGLALEIFGDRGGPAFEVLSSSIGDVVKMTDELNNAEGTARDIADVMDDNLQGSLLAVKSAFEAVIIAFGEAGATSGLRTALDALAAGLRFVADNADQVLFVMEALLAVFVAGKVLAFARALRGAAAAMVALEVALGAGSIKAAAFGASMKTIQRVGTVAFKALLGPIGAVISLLGAAIAITSRLKNEINSLRTDTASTVSQIQSASLEQLDGLENVIEQNRRESLEGSSSGASGFVNTIFGQKDDIQNEVNARADAALEALEARRRELITTLPSDLGVSPIAIPDLPDTGGGGGTDIDLGGGGGGGGAQTNEQLERRRDLLREITGDVAGLATRQSDLIALYRTGAISADTFTEAMRELNVEVTGLDNSFKGGISNGFARIAAQANDLGTQMSDFVVGAFDKASDAIVEFAKTGQFNLRAFFQDLFAQLLKLATNQLFSQLLGGGLGGGGLGGGLFTGLKSLLGFQNGGSFNVGGAGGADSQLVAFRATPGERVDISTRGQQAQSDGGTTVVQAPAPNVMVQITPRDITGALGGQEGDDFLVQGIEKNARAIKQVLGA